MDRITRFARPHCYDALQGPQSFLDGGRRSRSTPRMNVDPITRRACPERQGSATSSITSGFANSRLRAQSTDSLTWRRTVRSRQHQLASRQHMSHGELRTDSTERLANTVVINFSNSQIGEPNNVFAPSSPVVCTSPSLPPPPPPLPPPPPSSRTVVPVSSCPLPASPPEPPVQLRRSHADLTESAESKVRPVVETVAVHGRRLSYSRAAAADRLDSSDLDDLARQIGLLEAKQSGQPEPMAKRSAAHTPEPPNAAPAAPVTPTTATEAPSVAKEGRSRKGKMGWLGGLFRRLRHWPEHSSSASSSPTAGEERKKHRRRARSLPPTSKRSVSTSHASEPPSCDTPSTAGGSPTSKKASAERAASVEPKALKQHNALGEKPLVPGVSRSRTVDNIERARAFGSQDSNSSMPAHYDRPMPGPKASSASPVPAREANGAPEKPMPKEAVDVSQKWATRSQEEKGDPVAPKYCNLAVLAYGYRPSFASSEQLNSAPAKALEDRTNVTGPDHNSSASSPAPRPGLKSAAQASPELIANSRDSGQSSESVENARPGDAVGRSNGHHVERDNHGAERAKETKEQKEKESKEQKEKETKEQEKESKEQKEKETKEQKEKEKESKEQKEKKKEEKPANKDSGVTLDNDEAFAPDVPDSASIPRVRINVEPCEPCPPKEEDGGVVVRRKKAVSFSETTDALPRSSLIMLAVSQASPRPKTEFVACSEMPAPSKHCPMSMSQHEDLEPSAPEQRDGFYYLRLAAQVEAKFRGRMQVFEAALDSEAGLSEEASGFLRSVLGKANLLLTDKFAQLRGLCQQNISEQVDSTRAAGVAEGGFATRNSDLDGYWALVQLPVEDLEAQFRQLDAMRENGWRLPEAANGQPAKKRAPRRKKAPPAAGKAKEGVSASAGAKASPAAQARLEARKRLEAAKREAAAKMKAAANPAGDSDVFIFV